MLARIFQSIPLMEYAQLAHIRIGTDEEPKEDTKKIKKKEMGMCLHLGVPPGPLT